LSPAAEPPPDEVAEEEPALEAAELAAVELAAVEEEPAEPELQAAIATTASAGNTRASFLAGLSIMS
jgi:hypothetical protein